VGPETVRPLRRLAELGQAVWIDYHSRELLAGGGLSRLIAEDSVVGVTSNPTIFEHAISHGGAYDAQLRELLPRQLSPNDLFLELACADVADACDLLYPIWAGSEGRDGYVSIEVDPNLANEALAQFEQAKQLHERIGRPNLLVKIPATTPGVAAIEDSIADGRSINVTLIFSIGRYVEVARAYRDGLVRFRAAGGDVSTVHSVASFFVSRVDTETDRRLDALKAPATLKGELGIANAKLAYARYRELFSPEDQLWADLQKAGALPQRCLWASTSTKNPAYRDVRYVEELIGPETINTMPESTLFAFQDHGIAAPTLERGVEESRQLLERLAESGIDYDDVGRTLEVEGIKKFVDAFTNLLAGLEAKTAPMRSKVKAQR
jgi:transaldolase